MPSAAPISFHDAIQDLAFLKKFLYGEQLARDSNLSVQDFAPVRTIQTGSIAFNDSFITGYHKELFDSNKYVREYLLKLHTRSFSFLMTDYALVDCLYTFRKTNLTKQTMAIYPSPIHRNFDFFDDGYPDDEQLAGATVAECIPLAPLRFDYSPDNYREGEHPRAHLHIGFGNESRIPIKAPLTAISFFRFLLKHFYSTSFKSFQDFLAKEGASCCKEKEYPDCISDLEKMDLHVSFN